MAGSLEIICCSCAVIARMALHDCLRGRSRQGERDKAGPLEGLYTSKEDSGVATKSNGYDCEGAFAAQAETARICSSPSAVWMSFGNLGLLSRLLNRLLRTKSAALGPP